MFTVFSIPKAFKGGHTDVIQRNAVQSWIRLHPDIDVILCADDPGVKEVAEEFGVRHVPDVARNEFGTPIIRSALDRVREIARHEILCFVNADIILLRDFADAVRRVSFNDYLMVGQRWDVPITTLWDFDGADWEGALRQFTRDKGELHIPAGSDYFVFPRNSKLVDLPMVGVGRPGWDCWFIYYARSLNLPVIDVSQTVTVLHQNHDYSHVPKDSGGTTTGRDWHGPEVEMTLQMLERNGHFFDLLDATHLMTRESLRRANSYEYLRRRWSRFPVHYPRLAPVFNIVDKLSWTIAPIARMALPGQSAKRGSVKQPGP